MSPDELNPWIGIAIAVVPIFLIGWMILKRVVFWFLVALVVVGLGYLHSTGAAEELGQAILIAVNDIYPIGLEPAPEQ